MAYTNPGQLQVPVAAGAHTRTSEGMQTQAADTEVEASSPFHTRACSRDLAAHRPVLEIRGDHGNH